MNNTSIQVMPCRHSAQHTLSALEKYENWFYEFSFANGASTTVLDEELKQIHQTRAELIFPLLDAAFQGRWPQVRCLDIASHEGWFSFQLAVRKAQEVIGIDVKDELIERANLIKTLADMNNSTFQKQNIFALDSSTYGEFDVVFCLGLLYHVDNPMGLLRTVRKLTKNICVFETQVAKAVPASECEWGNSIHKKRGPVMAIVDADANYVDGELSIVFVPTLEAVYKMLYAVGFRQLFLSIPQPSMHQQYVNYDRVVIIAHI